jgi:hypothetical protein
MRAAAEGERARADALRWELALERSRSQRILQLRRLEAAVLGMLADPTMTRGRMRQEVQDLVRQLIGVEVAEE